MSLLTLSDLLAAYKTVSPDKEWALGGMENANKFANAIESAVLARLATVSVEPCAWEVETEQQDGTRAKWVSTDRKRHREFCDFGEPRQLYSQEAIAAARVQALEEAAKRMEGPDNNYGAVIRALIGGKDGSANEPSPNH